MSNQTEIPMRAGAVRKKRVSFETRRMYAREEMKAVVREEKKRAKNKRRYYLHRKCRECGLQVKASKWTIVGIPDPDRKQTYYMRKLMEIGYSVQEVIS